ncbi:MAG: hypothetical protein V1645_04460 [archaeon]
MGSYDYEDYRSSTTRPSSSRPSSGGMFGPSSTPPPKSTPKPSPTARASSAPSPVNVSADKISRPKGKHNMLLCFDTTGSMGEWRKNVREKSRYLIEGVVKYAPDTQIAVIGIGDHCDKGLMIQKRDFTSDPDQLSANLESIQNVQGGDTPEAYEDLFHEISELPLDNTNTYVILVCDSYPHGIHQLDDDGCPNKFDFRHELEKMRKVVAGFFVISCDTKPHIRQIQMSMVKRKSELISVEDVLRLTNTFQGVVAILHDKFDEFIKTMRTTRGDARGDTMMKTLRTLSEDMKTIRTKK